MGKIVAIITAGGSGKRIKSKIKKQYIEIAGRPLLFWTLDKFISNKQIDQIIITLPVTDIEQLQEKISQEYSGNKIELIAGGVERQDSVLNALKACTESTDFVLIHDGVRPFIEGSEIDDLIEAVQKKNAVVPICKLKNTIKQIGSDRITRTLPREYLAAALTPQVFAFELIFSYHKQAKKDKVRATDDASILEYYGIDVYYLECSSRNIKITDQFDLQIASAILENSK